jgi:hypothetical protein
MYIQKIEIENVRGFEKVELDLDRGRGQYADWTVASMTWLPERTPEPDLRSWR